MIQVYHGSGKGKTTAAIGAAVRAAGHGWPVIVVQFMKDARAVSGEVGALGRFVPPVPVLRAALPYPIARPPSRAAGEAMIAATGDLLREASDRIASGGFRLAVLDELGIALCRGWLGRAPVEELLGGPGRGTEFIITGRRMPRWLLERADLVTRMVQVRHPFDRGTAARQGIEY